MNEIRATIIFDDVVTEVSAHSDAGELWIESCNLSRATHFDLKPQGLCRGELCYPLPPKNQVEFLREEAGGNWFNLTAFARHTGQAVAHDAKHSTWYFGVRPDQTHQLSSLEAPDFTLPDIDGKLHSLSDFRGKKVFLVTWASW